MATPSNQYRFVTQDYLGGPYTYGLITGENEAAVERRLGEKAIPVILVKSTEIIKVPKEFRKKIPIKEYLLFCQQMEITQSLGMNILEAIRICEETSNNKTFKSMLAWIAKQIEQGGTLSDAMKKYPYSFNEVSIGLVRAGETAGILDKTFSQLKHMTKREYGVRKKIKSVMVEPAITIVMAILAIFILMWKTIPAFVGAFAGGGVTLPLPTLMLMWMSETTSTYPLPIGLAVAVISWGIFQIPKIIRNVPFLHKVILKVPVIGPVIKKLLQANFTRTMTELLKAEVPLLKTLTLCRDLNANYEYRGVIARAHVQIARGKPIAEAFADGVTILSPLVIKAMAFGERTGKTENVLEPLAVMLDEELNEFIENLKSIISPLLTVVIGGVILFIMLALFMPIFNLPAVIK
jgi:type IV pilus assembly protein PilC